MKWNGVLWAHTDLNFTVTGANSKVASFFGPGQWADVVLLRLQIHKKCDVSLSGIPQVHAVVKRHSKNISAAPVKQIQIWGKKINLWRCTGIQELNIFVYKLIFIYLVWYWSISTLSGLLWF